ncbi:MAG: AAA family ATPase [Prochloraceae cyanobacterium]|nr:AAA family ATPase [Prochloraceae cyanobacterium]
MIASSNYRNIELISQDNNTSMYRGRRKKDGNLVIMKIINLPYPNLKDITKIKHEYFTTKSLEIEGILKVRRLETHNNIPVLLFEDFDCVTLEESIENQKFYLVEFLKIAIQIAQTLDEIHQNNIIHKNIKPSNILINLKTQQVKLTDFSISSLLRSEKTKISNPDRLEGTLAYISPEQTGRMNRSVDYRTDFYSLGVTFYEMLTGKLLFTSTEPIELVHCHIAKQPIPPIQVRDSNSPINSEIPSVVSNIVMKLVAKTAEDRYQSALGLKFDLEKCLQELEKSSIISDFPLAQHDRASQLQIPQKLYGREAELTALMSAFERISQGTTEMTIVAGYSGIGKSALVNEIHKPITSKRGYFIAGKFEQFKRNIPYSSLIQAFQELMGQLLTESEARLVTWKEKLLDALGSNGQVIVDVIPEVEMIIGSQSPVPKLGLTESQNRFNLVFQKFIDVFANKEHPLVIFLDDLQWVDSASLKLIQLLLTDPERQYLLLIGAYRDNEVDSTHPLILTLDEIEKIGAEVNKITLPALDITCVNQLIADTLGILTSKTRAIAELVFHKTAGNPFFLIELLKSLTAEKLLSFDFSAGCWQWDIEKIQGMEISDNVVELMVGKIQKLSHNTQHILKMAASIGSHFDLQVLSVINEKSSLVMAADLWEALQVGLILPKSDDYKIPLILNQDGMEIGESVSSEYSILNSQCPISYKFLHDRVQQAAYALIPAGQQKEVHLKIGRLLLKNIDKDSLEENIFDLVNHLNLGAQLITSQSERYQLANLNLIAGRKAKDSTAYEPAVRYLNLGLNLLEKNSWQEQYELTLNLYLAAVEAEYLNTNLERAKYLSDIAIDNAKHPLEKVKGYELKIQFYISHNQMIEAIDTALEVLSILGLSLSQKNDNLSVLNRQIRRKLTTLGKRIEDLGDLPEMTDPYQIAIMRILMNLSAPAFIADPALWQKVILTMVNLSIEYGNCRISSFAYGYYGNLLCGALEDLDNGYQFGKLSLNLLKKFNAKELKAKIYVPFNLTFRHWKEHLKETIPAFYEGIHLGIESGDIEFACYNSCNYCTNLLFVGNPLVFVEREHTKYIELCQKLKQQFQADYLNVWREISVNLLYDREEKSRLISSTFNEKEMLSGWIEANNTTLIFPVYLAQTIVLYLLKDYDRAITQARLAEEYTVGALGFTTVTLHNFYYSLALLGQYSNADLNEQKFFKSTVISNQKKMKKWAYHCQQNYKHKYELVEAEFLRISGEYLQAMEYYDRAIRGARENGYIHEEAIAYERAAEFYFSMGREEIGNLYIENARHGYCRWGAKVKLKALEAEYPQLSLRESNRKGIGEIDLAKSTTDTKTEALDLTSVIKASQALASEIVLDKLLAKLMKTVIENAGAQKGVLILEKDGKWTIEAEGKVNYDEVNMLKSLPINYVDRNKQKLILPEAIVNYAIRTSENVVIDNAGDEGKFSNDPYIVSTKPKSILCTPLLHQGKLIGLLYLENNLTTGVFTSDRLEVLKILSSSAAISLQNAQFYIALQESEKKLAQFLEAVPVGVFVTNDRGQPYYANQTAQKIFGNGILNTDAYEKLQEFYPGYLSGTDRLYPKEKGPVRLALMGKSTTVDDLEIRYANKNVPVEVSASPIFDEKGKISYAIAAFTDITDRQQARAKLIEFTKELELKNIELQEAQETLAEYNRTLELKVAERTKELSQTIEVLKATQAKLQIENALFRSAEQPSLFEYHVGGSLPMSAPTYAVRSADRQLYQALKGGEFCYILNARQMGKSSLMVQMIHRLQNEGFCCAAIDMTCIGSDNITPEQWYAGFAMLLWQNFDLFGKLNFPVWWKERRDISPLQRLSQFIEEILLVEVGVEDENSPKKLAIFIDEIDSVLGLNFSVNDFFSLIRFCYNQRSLNPKYERLIFCIFGSASPSDLISDYSRTPFNIGRAIELEGFSEDEAQPLLQGLSQTISNPQTVLKEVLFWTNGQPFLTQKLCRSIRDSCQDIPCDCEADWIENLVRSTIIDNWESQDEPEHLKTIRDRILNSKKQPLQLLELYGQILDRGTVVSVDSPQERELILSGLVVKKQGFLRVRNRIYELIFNRNWVELKLNE